MASYIILLITFVFGYNIDTQTRDKFRISHGVYTMEVFRKDTFIGHKGEDFEYLIDTKSMGEGFNLTFKTAKAHVDVHQKELNMAKIKISTKNDHMIKYLEAEVSFGGGDIIDIAMDEVKVHEVYYTIINFKLKEEGITDDQ